MLSFDINPKLAGQNKIYRAYIKTKNQTLLLDPTNDVRLHSLFKTLSDHWLYTRCVCASECVCLLLSLVLAAKLRFIIFQELQEVG